MSTEQPPKPPLPHKALRQVRKATGLTQDEFGRLLSVSRAYAQAVELGQRPATPELAKRAMLMFGVLPRSIYPGLERALDLKGDHYEEESYRQHRSFFPQEATETEVMEVIEPLLRVLHVAQGFGKVRLALTLVSEALREVHNEVVSLGILRTTAVSGGPTVTVGTLRANSALAAAVGFSDDGTKLDHEVLPLDAKGRVQSQFPMLDTPHPGHAALAGLKRLLGRTAKATGKTAAPENPQTST